jgi:general stress protein 26
MEEINFERLRQETIDYLQANRKMVLATCADSHVTARTVSTINDGLKIFFQADRDYVKCRQIQQNSNVALACGNIQIEGKARITCHPLENSFFTENYQRYHESAFRKYSHMKDEVVIEVEPTLIAFWKYDSENKPFREYLLPGEKKAYREHYKKTD